MYPANFDYQKATSVAEALAMMAANPDVKVIAGGHSLLPAMKLRLAQPPALLDVWGIEELKGIRREGDWFVVGAMTTHADVLRSDLPLFPEVAYEVGDPMVRNRGTIGGSLAHADPSADYPAAALALGAEFVIRGPQGERVVPADQMFLGMFESAVQPGELLTHIRIPATVQASAYEKFKHPASHYAIVGVAVVRDANGQIRAAYTGAGEKAERLPTLEERLNSGQPVGTGLVDPGNLLGDRFASPEYRAHLVDVLAERAAARV
ncbi:xanthine dehydrogenase family protein subunit M [Deinococcus metallilatus]|uniref:Carbon-monoxide dehydrogenase medium subunit n=1 Tax=Deinococcus metallilatus TaxID=1211322 RepID=A0AAJ5F4Z3_9DEIO|nr:xanthine dehydrogenase family protein subunit M [Deinococcus metallilatus]MBB5295531.1 carbon-monoxide dehydrogenase medium subunit [Deinococcus metallilatus]QBY07955.1 xanthine dehydrogenase family protein subunit M [Deinococcus metallilatus]RXJ12848.1 xanthine dehydrogenase family protein subunit M [Deinococcus metallilatus]TLK27230.1 xanthine dehydrogenase family protein subunit M [Deinococcus metallilatus]GMA16209.1 carbon monoxide dehydrogenase [Deinococcus metallilatus]